MQFAMNELNERVHISKALSDGKYFCPFCGQPMIQRHGMINIEHFAHAKGYLCSDDWHYEEMSEWHRRFQNMYPEDCQEYRMTKDEESRRADVFINGVVVEFQHSKMTAEEFQKRNAFYTSLGYRVIWLFDAREAFGNTLTNGDPDESHFSWLYAPKTLQGLDLTGRVHVYFQLTDQKGENDKTIIRLTGCYHGDLKNFTSAPVVWYSEKAFVSLSSNGGVVPIENQKPTNGDLLCNTDDMVGLDYFKCPYVAEGNDDSVMKPGCVGYYHNAEREQMKMKYCGRFREILDDVRAVLEVSYYYDIHVFNKVSYINAQGDIRSFYPEIPRCIPRTLRDLEYDYNCAKMIVRNVERGVKFKITGSVKESLKAYRRVYGYLWYPTYNSWASQSKEIYGAKKPLWVLEWSVTQEEVEQYEKDNKRHIFL